MIENGGWFKRGLDWCKSSYKFNSKDGLFVIHYVSGENLVPHSNLNSYNPMPVLHYFYRDVELVYLSIYCRNLKWAVDSAFLSLSLYEELNILVCCRLTVDGYYNYYGFGCFDGITKSFDIYYCPNFKKKNGTSFLGRFTVNIHNRDVNYFWSLSNEKDWILSEEYIYYGVDGDCLFFCSDDGSEDAIFKHLNLNVNKYRGLLFKVEYNNKSKYLCLCGFDSWKEQSYKYIRDKHKRLVIEWNDYIKIL